MTELMHGLLLGPPGTGKTELAIREIDRFLRTEGRGGIYVCDWHGAMCEKVVQSCFENSVPCVVDCDRIDCVIPRNVTPIPGDDFESARERHRFNLQFLETLRRDQGGKDITQNPTIERAGCIVLDAWHRKPVISIGELYLACRPNTPQFEAIKDGELEQIQFMTGQQRDYQFSALERMLQRLSPDVQQRLVPAEKDIWDFVGDGGVFINALKERFIVGLDLLRFQTLAKAGRFSNWAVKVWLDESSKYVSGHEADGAEETRKFKGQYFFVDQAGEYGEFTQRIWNACGYKFFTGCWDAESAMKWGKMLRIPTYDPDEIAHKETRYRSMHGGYDIIKTHAGFDPSTKQQIFRDQYVARPTDDKYEQITYRSFSDQVTLDAQTVMNLSLPEFLLISPSGVRRHSFEMYKSNPEWEELAWQQANQWTMSFGITPSQELVITPAPSTFSRRESKKSRGTKSEQGEWHD